MAPGGERPPRASMGQDPHLPTAPKATESPFPAACGETRRERVNLLLAKLTLWHKEAFPGLCREAALTTHPKHAFSLYFFPLPLQ